MHVRPCVCLLFFRIFDQPLDKIEKNNQVRLKRAHVGMFISVSAFLCLYVCTLYINWIKWNCCYYSCRYCFVVAVVSVSGNFYTACSDFKIVDHWNRTKKNTKTIEEKPKQIQKKDTFPTHTCRANTVSLTVGQFWLGSLRACVCVLCNIFRFSKDPKVYKINHISRWHLRLIVFPFSKFFHFHNSTKAIIIYLWSFYLEKKKRLETIITKNTCIPIKVN